MMGWVVVICLALGFLMSRRTHGNPVGIALGIPVFGVSMYIWGYVIWGALTK